jgi:DNA-binding NarL/FixJ family response regulator
VIRVSRERADAVILDLDHNGAESALIAAELKRQRPKVPVIMLFTDKNVLAAGATAQANAVLLKSEESKLLHETLKRLLQAA